MGFNSACKELRNEVSVLVLEPSSGNSTELAVFTETDKSSKSVCTDGVELTSETLRFFFNWGTSRRKISDEWAREI